MADAICLRCGNSKTMPWEKCARCGYDPSDDEEAMVKSVYLSLGRFAESSDIARYRLELDQLGAALQRGEEVLFEQPEIERLKAQQALIGKVPRSVVWGAVLRLFLPAVGFILFLLLLAHLIRAAR